MNLITCKQLSLSYDSLSVVHDLSFSIEEGNLLYIIGENGSGKSTLIKALLGLHPIRSGEIIFDKCISKTSIGYMPQKTQAQRNFPASVWEVVLSGFFGKSPLFPFYTKDEKTTAENNLRLLSVLDLKKRSYQELSGGQQQRVLLARALCATEKILILDEPTAALDPHATAEFYDLILKLNKEHGITVLIISHDFEAAKRYATHVLLLDHHGNYFGKINDFLLSNEAKSFGKDHADVNHS